MSNLRHLATNPAGTNGCQFCVVMEKTYGPSLVILVSDGLQTFKGHSA
jgi:hypothetical protein